MTKQPPARGCFGQQVALASAFENDFDFSISASERVEICGEIEHVLYLLKKTREMRNITNHRSSMHGLVKLCATMTNCFFRRRCGLTCSSFNSSAITLQSKSRLLSKSVD